jgi:hypothetical protein
MQKHITIKVKIDSEFEINAAPNLDDWNTADTDSKNEYVKEQLRDYLLNNMEDLVEHLLYCSTIEF